MIEPDAPDAQLPMIEPDEPLDMGEHELPDPAALSDLPDLEDDDVDTDGIETTPPPDESLVQDTEEDE